MRIEEEENQIQQRRKQSWETAATLMSAPLEKTDNQGFIDLSSLIKRAFSASEADTVNRTMREYIELNKEADREAAKLQERIRFEKKRSDFRLEDQRGLGKREIATGN